MRILEYGDLDVTRVEAAYRKVCDAIARRDFRAAQVKKLGGAGHARLYRARLSDAHRLLFCLVRHRDEVCALMLEVILNHDYDSSRFLRGAAIDESSIVDIDSSAAEGEAQPLRYLHPERPTIHFLDKPISFDDAQDAVFRQQPPLIVVGSAGSGKTALTLEKLKQAEGEVLYVTLSPYLAQNARELYFANASATANQDSVFLSLREFVETIRVPDGREATWRDFDHWFAKMRQGGHREFDPHQVFEEFRGVIAAGAGGVLARDEYRALGVRQSIFPAEQRDRLHDLFGRYRDWLAEARLYDLNLVAHQWTSLAAPRYDFVVIDEVQDVTMAQLALVLKTLRKAGHFMLCGDSNQIVHPNFFSWQQVKQLFWNDPALAERQELRILTANYRNGREATRIANRLLKVKQQRFGSIDRESNFLVDAIAERPGEVVLVADRDATKRELDRKIRQSTQVAVLVMRDEDKAEARKHFQTPLLFSIHEAKGLEYENIVLYRFVSNHRAEFAEIAAGVAESDLGEGTLDYRRARDKADKSLEIYKFFVNALYVALTRAISNVYLIESDTGHALFRLLDIATGEASVDAAQSSLEDWQKEARKLELQGKQEQADAIRSSILKETPVPWRIIDQPRVMELLQQVFRDELPGKKPRQQLYEYACCFDEPQLARWLHEIAKYPDAVNFPRQRLTLGRSTYLTYFANSFKSILKQCEQHGIEHRLPMNQTPLIAAAAAGNVALVEALLERGANRSAVDQYGWNALHWALREAFRDPQFARGPFAALYEQLAPAWIDVRADDRLVRIDRHLSEYLLFQTLWVLFRSRFSYPQRRWNGGIEAGAVLAAWRNLPAHVVWAERNKRAHVSSVLSRNEMHRDYAYNRSLFMRVAQGWYQFNPRLTVMDPARKEGQWISIYQALNLPLVAEFAYGFPVEDVWRSIDAYLDMAGMPKRTVPIAVAKAIEAEAVGRAEKERRAAPRAAPTLAAAAAASASEIRASMATEPPAEQQTERLSPKWGTPEAKRLEIERIRRQIEERRKKSSE